MHAMVLKKLGTPLEWTELADRQPGPGEIRVKIAACGVCRTDLHVVDGELADPQVSARGDASFAISYQLSAISYQLSAISYQRNCVSRRCRNLHFLADS
jgi:hypothetical protein